MNSKARREKIKAGIELGIAKAMAEHKAKKVPVSIWENGKVKEIPPEQIQIPEEFKDKI